ncbi:MAG TPA: TAXI family TRAP transporter solute-binding subunit [Hyphomicrobiaceae bacterium]|nr:TAXI family TRAP transporter solute-binding subunit [Hyphomicrobiaceae bacterium]
MKMIVKSAIAVAAVLAVMSGPASANDMRIMTGPQGGIWVPLGGQLKDLWEKAIPGLKAQALPGAGVANARAIQEGKAEVGFGNTITTADAVKGNPPFDKKHDKLCNVATLYPQYFQVVVLADGGINSVKDIKGKTITTQQRGNTGELITQHILKANGLSYSDVKVNFGSYTESVEQMKDKQAQMFTLGAGIPLGAIMDLASGRDIKLLDLSGSINEMKSYNPGYTLVTVPKGTYPKQEQDVKVIGYATHVVAACTLPADQVYTMTKAIAENTALLANLNKVMANLTPKDMAEDVGVPFHPGAAKFYAEKGITVK